MTDGAYLGLDDLLGAQRLVSRPEHHDELLRQALDLTFFPELYALRTDLVT